MSVSELKRRLTEMSVSFHGVTEKRELQDLLRRSSAAADRARQGSRLHVQLHMEVVQLPQGSSGMRALEDAARRAAMAHMRARNQESQAVDAAGAPAAATSSTGRSPARAPNARSSAAPPGSAFPATAEMESDDVFAQRLSALRSAAAANSGQRSAAAASRTPATAPAESDEPLARVRRRRREYTPGEYSESKKRRS